MSHTLIFLKITLFYSHKYSSLTDLVEACKKNEQRGLACLLTEVCIKPRSSNEIADGGGKWDIPRSELKKEKELGRGNFGIVYKGRFHNHCELHFQIVDIKTFQIDFDYDGNQSYFLLRYMARQSRSCH